jgi:hypothetical protein
VFLYNVGVSAVCMCVWLALGLGFRI